VLKARFSDVVPVRELPYRPAAKLHQQAGQMAATDKCQTSRKRLRFKGRPQMHFVNWHRDPRGGYRTIP
jgi:hypothetical protein